MALQIDLHRKNGSISDRRWAEISYHRNLNRRFVMTALPAFLFFSVFYFFHGTYFQGVIFCLLSFNAILSYSLGQRLKNIDHLVRLKLMGTGIAFALLAVSMVSALLSRDVYICLPWIYIYPVGALLMFGERPGIIFALAFCLAATGAVLAIDLPAWDDVAIRLFKFNSIFALILVFIFALLAERSRVRMRNDLLEARNRSKAAEEQQRRTNAELKSEIAKREQSERDLSQSERRYRALFEESAAALWEENHARIKASLDGLPPETVHDLPAYFRQHPDVLQGWVEAIEITDVNRATLNLLGAGHLKDIAAHLGTILPSDVRERVGERICALHRTGTFDFQMDAKTLSGQKLHLLVRSTIPPGYEHTWQKVYMSAYDITAKVMMEEEKARAERHKQHNRQIQAIASLAGGIAHQVNNSLSAIFGSLDLLELHTRGHGDTGRFFDPLRESSKRIGHLTEQLLAYARGGKYQPRDFPVRPLIEDVLRRHSTVYNPSLKVTTRFEGDLVLAGSDVTQIKMVLQAVLDNAAEAMDNAGEINVRTCQWEPQDGIICPDISLPPKNYVLITIEDHGNGMDADTRERLFEPFFTTKFVGRGLGMAAAFGIVRNHEGMIDVESETGKGTRVMIYLPSAEKQESQIPA